MMDISEWLFLLSFLMVVGLTLFKAYNVSRLGRVVNIFLSVVFYILIILGWFTALQVLFSEPSILIYTMLHRLMSLFLMLSTILFFSELVMSFMLLFDKSGRVKFREF
jgi:hypothetical protein